MSDLFIKPRPVSLSFPDAEVEAAYQLAILPRVRWYGRIATLMGLVVYSLFCLLDVFHLRPGFMPQVWLVRGVSILGVLGVFAYSWHRSYTAHKGQVGLMLIGAVAGLSQLFIFWILPPKALEVYYSGLVLATFFTYNFIGTRFILALAANMFLLLAYNMMYGWLRPVPLDQLATHNLNLLAANVLGGTAAYFAEYQRRHLFLIERFLKIDRQQLRHNSLHDPLTELPNRVLLLDRIEQALTQARRSGQRGVVMFVDLDGFKAVNDTHGHEVGDLVLREAARRMRDCLRESDTLSRIGGDEFVLLSTGVSTPEQLHALSDKLLQVLQMPYPVPIMFMGPRTPLCLSASIGACFFPDDDGDALELIRRSDEAMYQAKRNGGICAVWSKVA